MWNLEVAYGIPAAAPLLVCYFASNQSTGEEIVQPLFKSMLTSRWLINVEEVYLHEAMFVQRAWLLPSATTSAAEAHWAQLRARSLTFRNFKVFSDGLQSEKSLVAVLRSINSEYLEWRVSRVSSTARVCHRYISYELASNSCFADPKFVEGSQR